MAVWRRVPRLAGIAPYALAAGFFVLASEGVGNQDRSFLAALWPAAKQWPDRPSDPVHTASLGPSQSLGVGIPGAERSPRPEPGTWPAWVDRSAKGDPAVPSAQLVITATLRSEGASGPPSTGPDIEAGAHAVAPSSPPLPAYDIAMSLEPDPQVPPSAEAEAEIAAAAAEPGVEPPDAEGPFGTAWLYFGGSHMSAVPGVIEPWAEGEAPIVIVPAALSTAAAEVEEAAREPQSGERRPAAVPAPPVRGRVIPAALLELDGRARVRAERCLANAVYFEARSEPVRGQIAVAQVVLNRAFSGYYPEDVCGVVYQGARRYLSCQFTFACDGIPDVVTEPEPWRRAQRIAKAMLDGKLWLPDVGKATHYHASYVNPYWVRSMRRLRRIGLHTFYRPRRWGDGSDAPAWGSPSHAEIAANL